MSSRGVCAAGVVCVVVSLSSIARAQNDPPFDPAIDVQLFEYAIGPKTFLSVADADITQKHQLAMDFMVTFLTKPFVIYDVSDDGTMIEGERARVIDSMLAGELSGAYGIHERMSVGVALPAVFNMTGDGVDPATGMGVGGLRVAGLGDLRVEAKTRLFQRETGEQFKLGAIAGVTLPSSFGSGGSKFLGDNLPSFRGKGTFQFATPDGRFSAGANLGLILRKPRTIYDTEIGQQLTWGLASAFRVTQRLSLVGETFGRTDPFSFALDPTSMEVGGGMRIVASRSLVIAAGGSAGVVEGIGSPEGRLFVSVGYAPDTRDSDGDRVPNSIDECLLVPEDLDGHEDGDGCVDDDNDGDRRLDGEDECVDQAEDLDGFDDDDGCPELDNDGDGKPDLDDACPLDIEDGKQPMASDGCPANKKDSDADGAMDDLDACPTEEEDVDQFEDWDGCPDVDQDKDGVADATDQCPVCPEDKDGTADGDGCPDLDNDSDGILDAADKCAGDAETINGVDDGDGCPDQGGMAVARLDGDALIVDRPPTFDRRGLSRAGQIIVDQMALVMLQHAEVSKWLLAIAAKKEADAQKHAQWVKARLVQRGVSEDKLANVIAAAGAARLGARVEERIDPDTAPKTCPAGAEVKPRDPPTGPATIPSQTPVSTPMPDTDMLRWLGTSSTIKFQTDSTTMVPGAAAELDALATAMVRYSGAILTVTVHSDNRKTPDQSLAITQRQADVIKAHLVGKGVAADRITALGKGSADPAEDNRTPEGRARNHRVELQIANR
jgi:outer membrane protein OmpA-like peptidoglycan-associated protein